MKEYRVRLPRRKGILPRIEEILQRIHDSMQEKCQVMGELQLCEIFQPEGAE